MPRFRIDFGSVPQGATSVDLRYRRAGSLSWHAIARAAASPVELLVADVGEIEVQARVVGSDGTVHPEGRTVVVSTSGEVKNRALVGNLEVPRPSIAQVGPALSITPAVPAGEDPSEYEVEVRVGKAAGAVLDAVLVGHVEPGRTITADVWSGEAVQEIHTRVVRKEDDTVSDWETVPVPVTDPTSADTQDHDSAWGGTPVTVMGGFAPLEVSGSTLRQKAVYAGDLTGVYAGDATDVQAGEAGLYFGDATYRTGVVDMGFVQDVAFQMHPEASAIARSTMYAGDAHWFPCDAADREDGTFLDTRIPRRAMQNGSDETPVVAEAEVAVSASASPTFTDADFVPHVPGKVYAGVRAYEARLRVRTWFDRRVTFSRWRIRRWCAEVRSCSLKPWSFVESEVAHGFVAGDVVLFTSSSAWAKARADAGSTMPALGIVVGKTTDTFRVSGPGRVRLAAHGLTIGSTYYVSPSTAGALTATKPSTGGQYVQPFCIPLDSDTLYILPNSAEVL